MKSFVTVDPTGLTWQQYTDSFIEKNPDASNRMPVALPEGLWSLWAECLLTLDDYDTGAIPLPHGCTGWSDWALSVMQVLN